MSKNVNSRYLIIHSGYLTDLMEIVSDFIEMGFVPCGGVSVNLDHTEYLQALYLPTQTYTGYTVEPVVTPPYTITVGST